ncbi:glucosaminidase domain-containing protein [Arcticibacter sp. MXS-1]|uniref:glucosaminidase domain and LysM peptidoglycan-binding domain-containing protein n=1 Tax=Arcticibacter sp. MXS-1 TaxID=3341726 RepID=UPI0035A85732
MLKKFIYVSLIVLSAGSVFGQNQASNYIETYKQAAINTMNEHGIPASIVLGIAIHESGSGTSRIARYLNNHFGLKGKSGPKTIRSSYKGYENVAECYSDFVTHLKTRFSGLFERNSPSDYRGWALGIQRGGYAHSRTWASQVMAIIKKYRLYELDGQENNSTAYSVLVPAQQEEEQTDPVVYFVKKGDTLLTIAERFGTTVKEIKVRNGLTGSLLKIGQRLHL